MITQLGEFQLDLRHDVVRPAVRSATSATECRVRAKLNRLSIRVFTQALSFRDQFQIERIEIQIERRVRFRTTDHFADHFLDRKLVPFDLPSDKFFSDGETDFDSQLLKFVHRLSAACLVLTDEVVQVVKDIQNGLEVVTSQRSIFRAGFFRLVTEDVENGFAHAGLATFDRDRLQRAIELNGMRCHGQLVFHHQFAGLVQPSHDFDDRFLSGFDVVRGRIRGQLNFFRERVFGPPG